MRVTALEVHSTAMSLPCTVYCAILGEDNVFQVKLNSDQSVLDLKEEIKAKRVDVDILASSPAHTLTLYKVDLVYDEDTYEGILRDIRERTVSVKSCFLCFHVLVHVSARCY